MKVVVDEKKNKELMEKQEIEIDIFAENENEKKFLKEVEEQL